MKNVKISIGDSSWGLALLVTFIVLKLTGVIGWSWWWVLSPLWLPLVFVILLVIIIIWGSLYK